MRIPIRADGFKANYLHQRRGALCDSEIPVSVGPSGSLILCQPQPPARRVPEQIPTVARIKELHGARRRTATDREYATKQDRPTANGCLGALNWFAPKPSRLLPFEQSGWAVDSLDGKGGQARFNQRQWLSLLFDAPIEKCREHVTAPAP